MYTQPPERSQFVKHEFITPLTLVFPFGPSYSGPLATGLALLLAGRVMKSRYGIDAVRFVDELGNWKLVSSSFITSSRWILFPTPGFVNHGEFDTL